MLFSMTVCQLAALQALTGFTPGVVLPGYRRRSSCTLAVRYLVSWVSSYSQSIEMDVVLHGPCRVLLHTGLVVRDDVGPQCGELRVDKVPELMDTVLRVRRAPRAWRRGSWGAGLSGLNIVHTTGRGLSVVHAAGSRQSVVGAARSRRRRSGTIPALVGLVLIRLEFDGPIDELGVEFDESVALQAGQAGELKQSRCTYQKRDPCPMAGRYFKREVPWYKGRGKLRNIENFCTGRLASPRTDGHEDCPDSSRAQRQEQL